MEKLEINAPMSESTAVARLRRALEDLTTIHSVRVLSNGATPAVAFEVELDPERSDVIFDKILRRFKPLGYTPALMQEDDSTVLKAIPGVPKEETGNPWVNVVLFVLTLLSVVFIGALNEGANPLENPADLRLGLPFAGALLGILTAHELSHYFMGRRYGSPVSLPYFIPLPISILGTMGAVITQKGPMRSRRALFDIGAAGPIGGIIVAVPLLIVGLLLSVVEPLPVNEPYFLEGNSILYHLIKWAIFGQPLPSGGMDVMLHPVAFAAWAGLMVTALNLFPVGQLDGGHVLYAMFGPLAWTIARVFVGVMFGWGLFLNFVLGNQAGWTWVVWGGLGLLMGTRHPRPLNDLTPLDWRRRVIGWAMVVLFFLVLVPVPLTAITP